MLAPAVPTSRNFHRDGRHFYKTRPVWILFLLHFHTPLFFFCFHHMPYSRHRMMKYHPGTGKTHHLSDFLPHFRLVAMNLAVGAESFRLHKGTFVAARPGIFFESLAFWTKLSVRMVIFFAVEFYHLGNHFLFPGTLVLRAFHQLILPCSTE